MSASLLTISLHAIFKLSANKLIGKIAIIQILVHVFLIDCYTVAMLSDFVHMLLDIVSFELYDPTEFIMDTFPLKETDPLNIMFESLGYESSDIVFNTGPVLLLATIFLILILFVGALVLLCGYQELKSFLRKELEKTFMNRVIQFMDGSSFLLTTCAWININQV